MIERSESDLTDYVTCRQRQSAGVIEFRWNSAGGEILGHRNERLIADLREALHYQAACPETPRAGRLRPGDAALTNRRKGLTRHLQLRTGTTG